MSKQGLFLVFLQCVSVSCWGHLLNMTEVEFTINGKNEIELNLLVDISRQYATRQAYYEASLENPCALLKQTPNTELKKEPSAESILSEVIVALTKIETIQPRQLTSGNNELSPDQETVMQWQDLWCEFPKLNRIDYLDPLQWPKVTIRARSEPLTSYSKDVHKEEAFALYSVFNYGFTFEEPISITFKKSGSDRRMTRWVIAGQASSLFPLSETKTDNDSELPAYSFYLKQGFLHILPKGLDHILFVLGLVLTTAGLFQKIKILTVFTLAHSVSMAAMVTDIIQVNMHIAEIFIALSIVWIGLESLALVRLPRFKTALVFAFGLIHGLGFASALNELTLPDAKALLALLSFNLGVELGQLAVVVALIILLALVRPFAAWYSRLKLSLSSVIILFGALWALQRISHL